MEKKQLVEQIFAKKSFLCVGLDTDIKKIPSHLLDEEDPIFAFNKAIIDATAPYCVAYKPNLAFYECLGVKGLVAFEHTVEYLKALYPNHLIIADAKRGDIGNTSAMYARTFFEQYDIDALTVAPYMGEDSVTPFLDYANKWVVLLALTSNKGSGDFQLMENAHGERLFEQVLRKSQEWADDERMMYGWSHTGQNVRGHSQDSATPFSACSRRGRAGWQLARSVSLWHEPRVRPARQFQSWHHLCRH